MGTSAASLSPAGIPPTLLAGTRGERYGRETLVCGYCGRGQFNRGQSDCIVCHRPLLTVVEPLDNSDADELPKAYHFDYGKHICARLRQLRLLLGYSQREMAEQVVWARCHITKYERGGIVPTLASLERLAATLRLNLAEVLDERFSVEALALISLSREPGQLMRELLVSLPLLSQHSRAALLDTAKSLSRPKPGNKREPAQTGTG